MPLKAIRAKCLDCCCWQADEVRLCPSKKCALHPYRFGHRLKGVKPHGYKTLTEYLDEWQFLRKKKAPEKVVASGT